MCAVFTVQECRLRAKESAVRILQLLEGGSGSGAGSFAPAGRSASAGPHPAASPSPTPPPNPRRASSSLSARRQQHQAGFAVGLAETPPPPPPPLSSCSVGVQAGDSSTDTEDEAPCDLLSLTTASPRAASDVLPAPPLPSPQPAARRKKRKAAAARAAAREKRYAKECVLRRTADGCTVNGRRVPQEFAYQGVGSQRVHFGAARSKHDRVLSVRGETSLRYRTMKAEVRRRHGAPVAGPPLPKAGRAASLTLVEEEYSRRRTALRALASLRRRLRRQLLRRYLCKLEGFYIIRERRRQREGWARAEAVAAASASAAAEDGAAGSGVVAAEDAAWRGADRVVLLENEQLCDWGGETAADGGWIPEARVERDMALERCIRRSAGKMRGVELLYAATLEKAAAEEEEESCRGGGGGVCAAGTTAACIGVPRYPNLSMLLEEILGVRRNPFDDSALYYPPSLGWPPPLGSPLRFTTRPDPVRSPSPLPSPSPSPPHRSPAGRPQSRRGVEEQRRVLLRRRIEEERGYVPAPTPSPAPPQGGAGSGRRSAGGMYPSLPAPRRTGYLRSREMRKDAAAAGAAADFLDNLGRFVRGRRVEANLQAESIRAALDGLRRRSEVALLEECWGVWRRAGDQRVGRRSLFLRQLGGIQSSRDKLLLGRYYGHFCYVAAVKTRLRNLPHHVMKRCFKTLAGHEVRAKRLRVLMRTCVRQTQQVSIVLIRDYYGTWCRHRLHAEHDSSRESLLGALSSELDLSAATCRLTAHMASFRLAAEPFGGLPVLRTWEEVVEGLRAETHRLLCLGAIRTDGAARLRRAYFTRLLRFSLAEVEGRVKRQRDKEMRKVVVSNTHSYLGRRFQRLREVVDAARLAHGMRALEAHVRQTKAARRLQAWWRASAARRMLSRGGLGSMKNIVANAMRSVAEERLRQGYCKCHGMPKIICHAQFGGSGQQQQQQQQREAKEVALVDKLFS
eukprot:Rhum_TRINITY_DN11499_c0_g1::Rhum_TRINITY_DN11499_c0_g1_i1::g.44940::m.44940